MILTELIDTLKVNKIKLYIENGKLKYRAPKHSISPDILMALKTYKSELITLLSEQERLDTIIRYPDQRFEPFPLTELQYAYWIGEQGIYRQTTTPYFYFEYDFPEQSLDNFAIAFEALVRRHDAFRLQVLPDGQQRIIPFIEQNNINAEFIDLRQYNNEDSERWLSTPRANIQSLLPPLGQGQPYFIKVARMKGYCRLFLALRLHMIDGPSVRLIFRDFLTFLQQAPSLLDVQKITPLALSFRDYVLARQSLSQQRLSLDKDYWLSRIDKLPSAPKLPLAKVSPESNKSKFQRLSGSFTSTQWKTIQNGAKQCGVSTNVVLCQLFADVLCQWSQEPAFCLNVLASQRLNDPEIDNLVGNCGTTMIVQLNNDKLNFADRCMELQQQMIRDFSHISYSGVSVIQLLQSKYGMSDVPVMPIVFTSGIPSIIQPENEIYNHINKVFSQVHTPQVWLDHQVVLEQGKICFYWDYVEEVFPKDLIKNMFDLYLLQIDRICDTPDWQQVIDAYHQPIALTYDEEITEDSIENKHLLTDFLWQCKHYPEQIAIYNQEVRLSYQQLLLEVTQLAGQLQDSGIKPGTPVAIQIGRGIPQIRSLLAVILVGAFYIPIDIYQPVERRNQILMQSQCHWLLVDDFYQQDSIPNDITVFNVNQINKQVKMGSVTLQRELTAYVIFTSGSTGTPKGVEITHRAVINTLSDIIKRFAINHNDKIIALSAYNFDLSVFDIFAALNTGASIVIPNESRIPDPEHWLTLCRDYNVTIWNSVPTLIEMVLYIANQEKVNYLLHSLRLIMLSGDWISLGLANQLLTLLPNTLLYSLGGATESAIWSNYYHIKEVDPTWRSIPYGFSLNRQQLWVLNSQLLPCQPWQSGEIYISGDSLAKGYYHDSQKTAQSFITHPTYGITLYKTGDLGSYHPEGYINIIGRTDFQIKIRGYRIEPGEIQGVIEQLPDINQSCVMSIENNLVAFISMNHPPYIAKKYIDYLKNYLQQHLPKYMIPDSIHIVESIPLTPNGKLDRKVMSDIFYQERALKSDTNNTVIDPQSPIAPYFSQLCELWKQAIGDSFYSENTLNNNSDFFVCGGNSLSAVKLMNLVKQKIGIHFPLSALYSNSTLQQQASWLFNNQQNNNNPEQEKITFQQGETTAPLVLLFHPVGGSLLCYREIYHHLPQHWHIVGFQSTEKSHSNLDNRVDDWYQQLVREDELNTDSILLIGWSMGGVLAYEMAKRFKNKNIHVLTIDSWISDHNQPYLFNEKISLWQGFVNDISSGVLSNCDDINSLSKSLGGNLSNTILEYRWSLYQLNATALAQHYFQTDSIIPLTAFQAQECKGFQGLIRLPSNNMIQLSADHFSIMQMPYIAQIRKKCIKILDILIANDNDY